MTPPVTASTTWIVTPSRSSCRARQQTRGPLPAIRADVDVLSGEVVIDGDRVALTLELGRPRLSGLAARLPMPAPPADAPPVTVKAQGNARPDGSLLGDVVVDMGRRTLDAEFAGRMDVDRSSLLVEGRWDVDMGRTRAAPLLGALRMEMHLSVHASRQDARHAAPDPEHPASNDEPPDAAFPA